MAAYFKSRPALPHVLCRKLWLALLVVPAAWGQEAGHPPAQPAQPCPLKVEYPLPSDLPSLRALAERQQEVSGEPGCLKSATFHAWRGATLLALGKPDEAVEPLERALLQDPDLPGAQLDLAQALAAQGDSASAVAFLRSLRQRADLPIAIGTAIDRQLGGLLVPDLLQKGIALATDWQSRWQFSALGGADSNLNNAPAASEITLTFPQGNVTLPLAPSSQPRQGAAVLGVAQWQGLKAHWRVIVGAAGGTAGAPDFPGGHQLPAGRPRGLLAAGPSRSNAMGRPACHRLSSLRRGGPAAGDPHLDPVPMGQPRRDGGHLVARQICRLQAGRQPGAGAPPLSIDAGP